LGCEDATFPGATSIPRTSPPAVTNLQPNATITDGWGADNPLWDPQTSVPVGYDGDGGMDPVSAVLYRFLRQILLNSFSYPHKVPKTPRLRTIPLPFVTSDDITGGHGNPYDTTAFPGGGNNNHQSTQEWPDVSAQEAEASTSLASAKPTNTENNVQSEVSSIFTPLEIVLCNNGLGKSRAPRLPQAREAVSTAGRTLRRKPDSSPKSAKCWESLRRQMNLKPFGKVC